MGTRFNYRQKQNRKGIICTGHSQSKPLRKRPLFAINCGAIQKNLIESDLFYRLNVFSLHIPPLRNRGNDIFLLVNHFLQKYQNPDYEPITCIREDAKEIFSQYTWPGNIHELENVMERVCILTIDGILIREALPSAIVNQVHTSALDTALPQGTRPEEKATAIPGKIMTADEIKKEPDS